MSIITIDRLEIIQGTFYTANTSEGTVWIPEKYFDPDTAPKPRSGTEYEKKECCGWCWYDSVRKNAPDNVYHGGFETEHEAFRAAYDFFCGQDWEEYAKRNNLDSSFMYEAFDELIDKDNHTA